MESKKPIYLRSRFGVRNFNGFFRDRTSLVDFNVIILISLAHNLDVIKWAPFGNVILGSRLLARMCTFGSTLLGL